MKSLAVSAVLLIFAIIIIRFFSVQLRKKYSNDIFITMYFFSLSFVASLVVAYAGTHLGAIDSQGNYQPGLGQLIEKSLHIMLDLNSDMMVLFAILFIVLVPQLLTYLISGVLAGSTSAPLFLQQSIRFVIWSVIKSLAVVSGIALTIAGYGFLAGWKGLGGLEAFKLASVAVFVLSLSFGILHSYREVENIVGEIKQYFPQRIKQFLLWVHHWLIRHENVSQQQITSLNK